MKTTKQQANIINSNERMASTITNAGTGNLTASTFDRSMTNKLTFNSGELIPFYFDEALPGDIYNIETTALIRQTTPIVQTMDNSKVSIAYFAVPIRLLVSYWKEFWGENQEEWFQTGYNSLPYIDQNATKPLIFKDNDFGNYLGVPVEKDLTKIYLNMNTIPFRAVCKIWNDYFRDQNFDKVLDISNQGKPDNISINVNDYDLDNLYASAQLGKGSLPVNYFPDYFQTLLPSPQKGESVILPFEVNTEIVGTEPLSFVWPNGSPYKNLTLSVGAQEGFGSTAFGMLRNRLGYDPESAGQDMIYMKGLAASSKSGSLSVNDLRENVLKQQYLELNARGGTRYVEWLSNHFGVKASAERLDRAEYLGGTNQFLNINQILQTAQISTTSPLGEVGGQGETFIGDPNSNVNYSVKEHSVIIGVMCVRPMPSYSQGLPKFFNKLEKEDFYNPLFANIGEQPIYKSEIMLGDNGPSVSNREVLGYNEAWADYRYKHNLLTGKFQANSPSYQSFAAWHYGIKYDSAPTLSKVFRYVDKNVIGKTQIFPEEPQFFADIYVNNKHTRPMPMFSIPGVNKI